MNIWKSLLAVCLLTAMFGCGAGVSKKQIRKVLQSSCPVCV